MSTISRKTLFDILSPESRTRDIVQSIRKILLGKPVEKLKDAKPKFRKFGSCDVKKRGKGIRIKTISNDSDTVSASIIFCKSLSPTYLHVILYILKRANALSFRTRNKAEYVNDFETLLVHI